MKWFFSNANRVMLTFNFLLMLVMFFGGIILTIFLSPVAVVFIFLAPLLLVMMHMPFIPRKYDTWTTIPQGFLAANKILRGMFMAETEEDYRKLFKKHL
jgi:hypothetical protein